MLPDATTSVEHLLAGLGYDPARPLVVLHTGATNGSAKRWPTEHYAALANRLTGQLGRQIALTGGPGDRALADAALAGMRTPALDLVGRTNLCELTALLARAALIICGDSGPLHIAVAVGTPVIGLMVPPIRRSAAPTAQKPSSSGWRCPAARATTIWPRQSAGSSTSAACAIFPPRWSLRLPASCCRRPWSRSRCWPTAPSHDAPLG